jgi:ABC-2 type transport system ATP-binding protein/lipopolysaccharide transport system ATP-binding protein
MSWLTLRDVSVQFPIYQGSQRSLKHTVLRARTGGRIVNEANGRIAVNALNDITLELGRGDRVGLIGPNGAGKTTLLRVMAGTFEPSRGAVESQGEISALFDVSLGFDAEATGFENIMIRGIYMGMSRREIQRHTASIAEFTELGSYLDMPVRTYSAGMMTRLAFGVATCLEPEILLMDEWLMAGDAHFLEKAKERISGFVNKSSILVLASHSEAILREWCTKAVYLDQGAVRAFGDIEEVLDAYKNHAAGRSA